MQTQVLDGWRIQQCGKLFQGTMESQTLSYEENAESELITISPNEVFSYTDSKCPIQSCTFHLAGECGGNEFQEDDNLTI